MIRNLLKNERYSVTIASRELNMCRQTLEKKLDEPWTFDVETILLLSKMVHVKTDILFRNILDEMLVNGKNS